MRDISMKILLPKEVDTLEKLKKFLEPTDTYSIEPRTKRKGIYCFGFSQNPNGKIDYLIDDGKSSRSCRIENFNRYINFVKFGE
jgi:hypothetical protein